MADLTPGELILYRDGDRFFVARIDLVGKGYHTAFPFDPLHRRWAKLRRRIAKAFIVERLPATTDVPALVRRIECLRNQRDAKRKMADTWLQRRVSELLQPEEA